MIQSKKELAFYIAADRIMNGFPPQEIHLEIIKRIFLSGANIPNYLKYMRYYSYYKYQKGCFSRIKRYFYYLKFRKLGIKLSFSIGEDVFGYGLCIPHYGTIVVGGNNKIGNYAVLNTSTCISAKESVIGNGLYLATGAKITKQVFGGDGVSIGANSVVNKSFGDHCLIAGAPAKEIRESPIWYENDITYYERIKKIETLKNSFVGFV